MLAITGNLLSTEDKRFIRYATTYTLDYLMPNINRKDYKILIDVSPETAERNYMGECSPILTKKGCRKATVWINELNLKHYHKSVFSRIGWQFRKYLFHELVHVKQYFLGELKDLPGDRYKFKGVVYKNIEGETDEGYYMSGYEMEARGYEEWLQARFSDHLARCKRVVK